jgi:hypothetical protein
MALTHTALQALKPGDKNYAVSDRDGLFIEVRTSGAMVWRYKYRFAGKREKLTIGPYPAIGLAQARTLRNEATALLALGQSPARGIRGQTTNILSRPPFNRGLSPESVCDATSGAA